MKCFIALRENSIYDVEAFETVKNGHVTRIYNRE